MKRIFDIVVAFSILIVASPVMIVIAMLVRTTSEGPAIFAQTRVGRDERVFRCFKFRTMASNTPDVASHQASQNWITPIGSKLRRWKLDELPQLINVLLGEMSLVGPRPCLPSQNELIQERRRLGVFTVRPGITGKAQLAGVDMSEPMRLAMIDSEYIKEYSFWNDFKMLVSTALGQGSGDAAKRDTRNAGETPVLILGARSDIAQAIASRFAVAGHAIQLAARNPSDLDAFCRDLSMQHGVSVSLHEFDVLCADTFELFAASLPAEPEIVISVVGLMTPTQTMCEVDLDAASLVMRTNFEGPANILGFFGNRFATRKHGTLIGISSVSGARGRAKNYVYGASKAAFTTFLSGLRNRLSGQGVQVMSVILGFVKTRQNAHVATPTLLTAQPDQVADAIYHGVRSQKDKIYVLKIWFLVLITMKSIPETFFKKMNI